MFFFFVRFKAQKNNSLSYSSDAVHILMYRSTFSSIKTVELKNKTYYRVAVLE